MSIDIQFDAVTKSNLHLVLARVLLEHQRAFIESIESSIELAEQYQEFPALAITIAAGMRGSYLLGIDEDAGTWQEFSLAIDKTYQRKDIGFRAMDKMLNSLWITHSAEGVLIVFDAEKAATERIETKLGIFQYGSRGEKILALVTRPDKHITCN
jgi:hypothetical protein